jgi:hypothetical protein
VTIIKAGHPGCPEVELRPDAVTLNVSERRPDLSHYSFTCPACGQHVAKLADSRIINLLTAGGAVPKTRWEPPSEVLEAKPAACRRALTLDDVIDFGLALQGCDDMLSRWAA